jgi:alkaline phosphatase
MKTKLLLATSLVAITGLLGGCLGSGNGTNAAATQKNVIFFLGDGMGMATLTAARIYKVGEAGDLTIDTLPESGFVKTYSNNSQVTDSAPGMAGYMTGVKMNNEVLSMSPDTNAFNPATGVTYVNGSDTTCQPGNGTPVTTLLELAKAAGRGTGVVTTTRITHATPAVTYAHLCHRDGENQIAEQLTPGHANFNTKLGDGVDVILGGGWRHFVSKTNADGTPNTNSKRTDTKDLTAMFTTAGYKYVKTGTEFKAVDASVNKKLIGLFNKDHVNYDLDRKMNNVDEPSLADMTAKAIDVLAQNNRGFFLMVEGGRIDHALHETTARKALQDTVAFDEAIKKALDMMQTIDPGLKNTLIVVTADHDHTLVLNGYAQRTGPSTDANPGVLGLLKNVVTGLFDKDVGSNPYTIIGFGNGENRPAARTALTDAQVFAPTYHQEAVVPMPAGGETHGGTDVFIGAIGLGSEQFAGVMNSTDVFGYIKTAVGL